MDILNFTFVNAVGFLFAFVPGLISFALVIYILTFLPRNRLVNVFTALTLSGGIWQVSDAISRISGTEQMADFWERFFCFGWVFIGALCLHFSLLYSRIIIAHISPWIFGVLYLPSFIFLALYQMPIYNHHFHYLGFWGWVNNHNNAAADELMVYWLSLQVIIACGILFHHSYKTRADKLLFYQSILIAVGIAIPAAAGIFSQAVFPIILNRPAIPATSAFLIFLSLSSAIALSRFKLFAISELINNEFLLDKLSVVVLSISDTWRITYINKYGADLFGINRNNLQNFKFNKMLRNSMAEHERNFIRACSSALKGEDMKNVESSLVVKGGTMNILLSASPIINNNQVRGALISIRDITELKQSTQLIRQRESVLREAQKISHVGSFEWNLKTDEIKWSDELYHIYGLNPEKDRITFESVSKFIHPEDTEYVNSQTEIAREEKKPVDFKYRIVLNGTAVKYLNTKIELISESPDKLTGTVQDITPQVESENALQQKNQELQLLNTNLEEFVFVASHDLKEPVRKIITFTEMIKANDAERLSEKGKQFFERLVDAAHRMQVLIDGLLSLSTITRNNDFQNYSLQKIVHEATSDLDLKIKEKNAIINARNLPEAYIIPVQFRQLFYNLISNSLKFSKKDIPIVINISACQLPHEEIEELSLPKNCRYLKIILEDNGIGFENEYAEKIFQMFQRLHGKVDYEGTGIGLAICKKIVENHKGIIYASGAPSRGAIFTVIIPKPGPAAI
jgi:PAS domain S-box-containing protein